MKNKMVILWAVLFVFVQIPARTAEPEEISRQVIEEIEEILSERNPFEPVGSGPRGQSDPVIPGQEFQSEGGLALLPPDALKMQTVMMKFLQAANIAEVVSSMNSPYGSVAIDLETNSLVICDLEEQLEQIVQEIRKADRMPEQIMIEALIIDVKLADDKEIGVNWDNLLGGAENNGGDSSQLLINSFSSATPATSGMDFRFLNGDLSVTLHALLQNRDAEVLATPRVLVLSGKEAVIKTVEEIPYIEASETSEGGSLTSTEFKEVGVTLTVKATVTEDGKIQMTITPTQSVKTGESVSNVPIVDSREATTTLMVNDGQTVVMGGLRRKETRLTTDKVPLLGDIPLLGLLFSREKAEVSHSELVLLIRPHIENEYDPMPYHQQLFDEMKNHPPLELHPKDTNLNKAYAPADAVVSEIQGVLAAEPEQRFPDF